MRLHRVVVATALVLVMLVACGLQPEDPALALRQGGAAIATLKTVTATLKVTKGTITFQGFALVSATASVRLPDQSDSTYLVREKDFQLGLQVVIIGGHVWLKPPLLKFEELNPDQAAQVPDLARLFDPTTGIPAVIPAGKNPKYQAVEKVADVESHKVTATYSADQIRGMMPQLASIGDVEATIWVGGSDHYIRKAVLRGKFGDNGTDGSVEVDLSGFNSPVNITSPARTG
jgi:hypothetical protein